MLIESEPKNSRDFDWSKESIKATQLVLVFLKCQTTQRPTVLPQIALGTQ